MTWGLRALCNKTVAVLEGGYDLAALERSSEAVIRTLQISPEDKEGFNKLLAELSGKPD
jgi:acetoin utilization deacetylase AcuC-like enzyme